MSVLAMMSAVRNIIRVGGLGPGASDADVARELGIPPWKVSSLRQQWSRWSGDQRRPAASLVELADTEALMKGGSSPVRLWMWSRSCSSWKSCRVDRRSVAQRAATRLLMADLRLAAWFW